MATSTYSTVATTRTDAAAVAKEVIGAGAVGGVLGGVVMAMFAMMYTATIGAGFWMPLRGIAATFLGVEALVTGAGALILGISVHMAVSIGWGVLFALLVKRTTSTGAALAGGLAYGLGVLLFMSFVILPWTDRTMLDRVALMPVSWIVEHLLFGACLAVVPALRRAIAEQLATR